MYCARWSNEAATVPADITADHRDVPAPFVNVGSCTLLSGYLGGGRSADSAGHRRP